MRAATVLALKSRFFFSEVLSLFLPALKARLYRRSFPLLLSPRPSVVPPGLQFQFFFCDRISAFTVVGSTIPLTIPPAPFPLRYKPEPTGYLKLFLQSIRVAWRPTLGGRRVPLFRS